MAAQVKPGLTAGLLDNEDLDSSTALSPHVLLEVAKHLRARAVRNCRLVCKQWREAFSLAVASVNLDHRHKLQHTLQHLQHTFPRLYKVKLGRFCNNRTAVCTILQAMSKQQSIKELHLGYELYSWQDDTSILQVLPPHLQSLQTNSMDVQFMPADAFSRLTALTRLSTSPSFVIIPYEAAADQLVSLLASAPSLQQIDLTIHYQPSERTDPTGPWMLAFMLRLLRGSLLALPAIQEIYLHPASEVEWTAGAVRSLAGTVQECASANLRHVLIECSHLQELKFTSQAVVAHHMHIPMYVQQEHAALTVAEYQSPDIPALVMQPQHLNMAYNVDPQLSRAVITLDCQRVDGPSALLLGVVHARVFQDEDAADADADAPPEALALPADADADADVWPADLAANVQEVPAEFLEQPDAFQANVHPLSAAEPAYTHVSIQLVNASHVKEMRVFQDRFHSNCLPLSLLGSVGAQCSALQSLHLVGCSADLEMLGTLTCLTALNIEWSQTTDVPPYPVNPAWLPRSLQKLEMYNCLVLSCQPDQQPQMTNLQQLDLWDSWVSDEHVFSGFCAAAHSLELLGLCGVGIMHGEGERCSIIANAARTFPNLHKLSTLDYRVPATSADSMVTLASCVATLKHLHTMHLPWAVCNSAAIANLASMTQLENFSLRMLPDDPARAFEYIMQLAQLPGIKDMSIRCKDVSEQQLLEIDQELTARFPDRHKKWPLVNVLLGEDPWIEEL